MVKAGADIIDIGGESTRPGSKIISQKKELQRVAKVIEKFKKKFPKTLLSIDTRKSLVMNFSLIIKQILLMMFPVLNLIQNLSTLLKIKTYGK